MGVVSCLFPCKGNNIVVQHCNVLEILNVTVCNCAGGVVLYMEYGAVRRKNVESVCADKQDVQVLSGTEHFNSADIGTGYKEIILKLVYVECPSKTGCTCPSIEAYPVGILATEIDGIIENCEIIYVISRNFMRGGGYLVAINNKTLQEFSTCRPCFI